MNKYKQEVDKTKILLTVNKFREINKNYIKAKIFNYNCFAIFKILHYTQI